MVLVTFACSVIVAILGERLHEASWALSKKCGAHRVFFTLSHSPEPEVWFKVVQNLPELEERATYRSVEGNAVAAPVERGRIDALVGICELFEHIPFVGQEI